MRAVRPRSALVFDFVISKLPRSGDWLPHESLSGAAVFLKPEGELHIYQ